jgi:putative tryptophan/tyrosine transport system substrate-binding protein
MQQLPRSATATVPIVFNVTDPVRLGLADSLSRPGGNATGVNVMAGNLGPKRLGLLRDLLPHRAVACAARR